MREGQYRSFFDYEKDVKKFVAKAMESAPEGPNRKEIILEFVQKVLVDAGTAFVKALQADNECQRAELE